MRNYWLSESGRKQLKLFNSPIILINQLSSNLKAVYCCALATNVNAQAGNLKVGNFVLPKERFPLTCRGVWWKQMYWCLKWNMVSGRFVNFMFICFCKTGCPAIREWANCVWIQHHSGMGKRPETRGKITRAVLVAIFWMSWLPFFIFFCHWFW